MNYYYNNIIAVCDWRNRRFFSPNIFLIRFQNSSHIYVHKYYNKILPATGLSGVLCLNKNHGMTLKSAAASSVSFYFIFFFSFELIINSRRKRSVVGVILLIYIYTNTRFAGNAVNEH